MKKKLLLSTLILSCAAFAVAASACQKETPVSVEPGSYTVEFVGGTGFSYVKEQSGSSFTVEENEIVSFSLDVGAFYTGTPVVQANDVALASVNGVYSMKVTADTTVKVNGIQKDVSNMLGTGAFDDAFVVSRPIDLVYIAERVNAGDTTYSQASYVLANDIDCKGATLSVIGNLKKDDAFFSGCFSCYTDSETNEVTRYTISNFKIDASNSNYVGLFGCVQANPSISGSGLFYGIRLENFVIEAGTKYINKTPSLYCGSLIGYGVGVNAYLCDATNGEIKVFADDRYFAYAGGLIGCQQGYFAQDYDQSCPSEIAYATVDVDVSVLQGAGYYAGGIVGYALTDTPTAPALIHNAYATGSVSGAARAGGIVGGLGQHASVTNCYSTGDVSAYCSQNLAGVAAGSESYCYAYAGGLVGYAENDTVVTDSFTASVLYAQALEGSKYAHTSPIIGGGDEAATATVNAQKYIEFNNADDVSPDEASAITKDALGWRDHDWTFTDGSYPVINYEPSDGAVATVITIKYVTKAQGVTIQVGGLSQESVTYEDSYAPIVNAFNSGALSVYLQAENGYLSYGYFFDEACTKPVPYSFLTTRDLTLFVGFADPTPVVGEYTVETVTGTTSLTLLKNGTATYTDGETPQICNYQFDGELLLLENAKFSQTFTGAVDPTLSMNEDAFFDLNRYAYFNYYAKLDDKQNLCLYDGVYYTKDAPLIAYNQRTLNAFEGEYYTKDDTRYVFRLDGTATIKASGQAAFTTRYSLSNNVVNFDNAEQIEIVALFAYDAFKGTWYKRYTAGKYYVFDGKGGFECVDGDKVTVGTYELEDDGEFLITSNDVGAAFDEDGFLCVNENNVIEFYYSESSYAGTWRNTAGNVTLQLYGLNRNGVGKALVTYADGYEFELLYERSATTGYVCLYLLEETRTQAGVITYKTPYGYACLTGNTMSATLYDPLSIDASLSTGYGVFSLRAVDDLEGEWVSGDELLGLLRFDGTGVYGGTLYIDGTKTDYTLDRSEKGYPLPSGKFTYQGYAYTFVFDDLGNVVNVYDAEDSLIRLERKDAFADIMFTAFDPTALKNGENAFLGDYVFDGRGNLESGGSFTYTAPDGTQSVYVYKTDGAGGYVVWQDIVVAQPTPEAPPAEPANPEPVPDPEPEPEPIVERIEVGKITRRPGDAFYTLTINGDAGYTHKLYVRNEWMGAWAICGEFELLQIGATDLYGNISAIFRGVDVQMQKRSPVELTFSCELNDMPVTYFVFLLGEDGTDGIALSEYQSLAYGEYTLCSKVDAWYGVWTQKDGAFSLQFDGASFAHIPSLQNRYANGVARLTYAGKHTLYDYRIDENGALLMWSQELLGGSTLYYTLVECDPSEAGAYVNGEKAYKRVRVDSLFGATAKDGETVYTFDGGNIDGKEGTVVVSDGKTYSYTLTEIDSLASVATLTLKDKESGKTYTAKLDYSDSLAITITLTENA